MLDTLRSWERTVPEVVEAMGERAVGWGSQYPLPDILHFCPNESQSTVADRHLTEEAKRRTLGDNAADLFHIGAGHRSWPAKRAERTNDRTSRQRRCCT